MVYFSLMVGAPCRPGLAINAPDPAALATELTTFRCCSRRKLQSSRYVFPQQSPYPVCEIARCEFSAIRSPSPPGWSFSNHVQGQTRSDERKRHW